MIKNPSKYMLFIIEINQHRQLGTKIKCIRSIFSVNVYILLFSNKSGVARKFSNKHYKNKQGIEDIELPTFDLSVLANATENYSTKNKLGEGGFGPVYKVMNETDV